MADAPESRDATVAAIKAAAVLLLADAWIRATGHLSSRAQKFSHPAYQAILALGPDAVRPLLRWIRAGKGGQWDEALERLTNRRAPIVPGRTSLSAVMRAWVEWGEDQGLIERGEAETGSG